MGNVLFLCGVFFLSLSIFFGFLCFFFVWGVGCIGGFNLGYPAPHVEVLVLWCFDIEDLIGDVRGRRPVYGVTYHLRSDSIVLAVGVRK